jgi:dTDP-4-dehydrorhamnose 3,5-epimerase
MTRTETTLPGVCILQPKVFTDSRGQFFESYRADVFASLGIRHTFVQDNHSLSHRGVIRGLHYQLRKPQAKLVRVVLGEVFDVVVDIRRGSSTFGNSIGEILSANNRRMMFIPEGFAHGFYVLSEAAEVIYKASDVYAPSEERGVRWDSPELGISWPIHGTPILSDRDAVFPVFSEVSNTELPAFMGDGRRTAFHPFANERSVF